ncbi:phospholipase D-like domain-containing protein [Tropicimonas sp. IMCC34043]|uniref:phospholipase D-like domain-containing protein n=1 Tax=Tropicimonas sp. IMCC34043 TaxID=2248760 RepID=UPI0018E5111A|nr:phospholipase D-like domain-containing protein [Tropicimonas sp. IMCC34043]
MESDDLMHAEAAEALGLSETIDGGALYIRAIDPGDRGVLVLARPGERLRDVARTGDLLLRLGGDGRARVAILVGPEAGVPRRPGDLPGRYVHVRESGAGAMVPVALRLAGPDGLMLPGRMLVRRVPDAEAEELPQTHRPTLRNGSRGPAVAELQARLNAVHARRQSAGSPGLDRCPLTLDGAFGTNTRRAVIAFQRLAFPERPSEWDGVVGARTWAALESFLREQPPLPIVPPLPILPVVHVPLDPSRWGPILRPHLSARAVLRSGNAVHALIDGPQTFRMMTTDIRAASGTRDFVYLLGWDNFDDFELVPGDAGSTFRALFTAAAARGVEVAAMLWQQPLPSITPPGINPARISAEQVVRHISALPGGKAILDDLTTNNTLASRARLAAALAAARVSPLLVPVILRLIKDDLARLGGSHHQKVLVVRRGETLVGYCGGLDMNPNRLRVVDPHTGQPHHDDHCRVIGPSAFDLLSTFLSRWRHHPASAARGRLRGETQALPAPITHPSANDAPHGGPVSVIVARTFNPTRNLPPLVQRERDIKPLLLAAIGAARRFIYCEDQYLIDLDTADALRRALGRVAHVTILIPGTPISDLPFAKEYRRDFVERVVSGLSAPLRAKFGVFQLSRSRRPPPIFGDHTYVHAKSWIFDDELAVIGTANCNRRGYTFDSEVDAFVFDDAASPTVFTASREQAAAEVLPLGFSFAQSYRVDLWRHHLGVPAGAVADGVASAALWRGAARPPSARVVEFDHRIATPTRRAVLEQRIMDIASDKLRDLVDPVGP